MLVVNLNANPGKSFPARRTTRNIVGGRSPIQSERYSMGIVSLEPDGGQVPWHNHEQEEVYVILEGEGEICVGEERRAIVSGEAVFIPPSVHHQLTNTGSEAMTMIYCYAPGGEVDHWKQELEGTLPKAGVDAPALPDGAAPQHT